MERSVTLEVQVDKFDGRTLTEEGNYSVNGRIGRLFFGQGRAERVVVHEATGNTRTYTYIENASESGSVGLEMLTVLALAVVPAGMVAVFLAYLAGSLGVVA